MTTDDTHIGSNRQHRLSDQISANTLQKPLFLGLLVVALAGTVSARADSDKSRAIQGGGITIVTGGGPGLAPVITKFDFHWRDGEGKFECLALAPSAKVGSPGSGNFDTNVMYVTGKILSAEIEGPLVILKGTATVTGLGAGTNLPFTATAEPGGPGTRMVLSVSGLVFDELINEGAIEF